MGDSLAPMKTIACGKIRKPKLRREGPLIGYLVNRIAQIRWRETTMLIKLMPSIAILHNPNAPGVLSLV